MEESLHALLSQMTEVSRATALPPVFPPANVQTGQMESSVVILPGEFRPRLLDRNAPRTSPKPTKKALSALKTDRAAGVETKGLEPSTSALRTQRPRSGSEALAELTATSNSISPCASPCQTSTRPEDGHGPAARLDFTTAVQAIITLPLTDLEKAEAVRRLLADQT